MVISPIPEEHHSDGSRPPSPTETIVNSASGVPHVEDVDQDPAALPLPSTPSLHHYHHSERHTTSPAETIRDDTTDIADGRVMYDEEAQPAPPTPQKQTAMWTTKSEKPHSHTSLLSPTETVIEETVDVLHNEAVEEAKAESPTAPPEDDKFKTRLDAEEDPLNKTNFQKWMILIIISSAATLVTSASSVAALTGKPEQDKWHISAEVAVLGVSLCIEGLGIGPLLFGPLSEFYGRKIIYIASLTLFLLVNLPVALAPNYVVFCVFRFFTGFTGAAFLSVAGGSVTDLWRNEVVGLPMAIYTCSPFLGPIIGPPYTGFVVQNTSWRWVYWVIVIWAGIELALIVFFVPETHRPTLEKQKAKRLRKQSGDDRYYAALERGTQGIARTLQVSCTKPFVMLVQEPMALAMATWSALLLGIVYLFFEAFPEHVFGAQRHFNTQESGMSFFGIGIGIAIAIVTQPFWVRVYREERIPFWEKAMRRERAAQEEVRKQAVEKGQPVKAKHEPEPEARLLIGMVGAILVPISLFWFAGTSPHAINWVAPALATIPFGCGVIYSFMSMWTFLVHAYRPHAASAMAGNSLVRCSSAAAFPLFSNYMYVRLGVVGATCLLAGLTTLMVPLPFLFYHYGRRFRKNSKYAIAM